MRYAILTDIHGNYEALQAVIDDYDAFCLNDAVHSNGMWCLGDIVGYGPDPSACVRTIRSSFELSVAGNHDWGASGLADLNEFSDLARNSLMWTSKQLLDDERHFLSSRPDRTVVPNPEDCTLVHGSPVVPLWEYLLTPEAASLSFLSFPTRFCVVGHTHLPAIYIQEAARYSKPRLPVLAARERQVMEYGSEEEGIVATTVEMEAINTLPPCYMIGDFPTDWWLPPEDFRAIVNPGSVGQPRDGNAHAAYVIYDTIRGFLFRRVPYWMERTMEKMHAEGFPDILIDRLAQGY